MPIYQIDPSQAASGLRYQFAKDLPALANSDQVIFRNGFYHPGTGSWGYSPSTANFTGLDNFTVANYGTGMRAVLDPRLFEEPGTTADWTIVRTTGAMKIWRKLMTSAASAAVDRMWFGATRSGYAEGQRTDGVAYARLCTDTGELYYTDDTWRLSDETAALNMLEASPLYWTSLRASSGGAASDRVLYIKVLGTGSDFPPAVYGGFAFTQRGASTALDGQSPAGIIIRDGTDYLIDGVCVGGDRAIDAPGPTTKTSTAILRNVTASYFDKRGISFNSGAAFGWSSILIEDFIIDSITSEEEQDPTVVTTAFLHSSEGVEITTNGAATIDSVIVQNGNCNGIGHGGISVTGDTGTLSNVIVRFNKTVSPDWQLDVRHYVMQGVTGTGNKLYGNVSDNQDTKCEFGGNSEIYGNYFLNNRTGLDPAARQVARIGGTGAGAVTTNFKFHHNYILGTRVVPLYVAVGQATAANAISITDNVIQMHADAGTLVFDTGGAAGSLDNSQIIARNHVEIATGTPQCQWKSAVDEAWTTGPAAVTGWSNNTYGTRLSEIPTSLYPPSTAAAIFGGELTLSAIPPPFEWRAVYNNFGRGDIKRDQTAGVLTFAEVMQAVADYGFNQFRPTMLGSFGANFTNAYVPQRPSAGTDQLQACMDAQAATGVTVMPWIECWVPAWQDKQGGAPYLAKVAELRAAGAMFMTLGADNVTPEEPTNGAADSSGSSQIQLSPASTVARAHMTNAIVDMVTTHPGLAGIILDYNRYPSFTHQGCFSTGSRAAFEAWSGSAIASWPTDVKSGGSRYASWLAFHELQITSWTAEVAAAVRAASPGTLIGCTPFTSDAGRAVRLQNIRDWALAGSIDFMEPQVYPAGGALATQITELLAVVAGTGCDLYPLTYTAGTTLLPRDPAEVSAEREYIKSIWLIGGMGEFAWVTEYATGLPELMTGVR